MEALTGLVILAIGAACYFAPAIIAQRRQHHQTGPIFIVNLLLGWTFLGWVVALAWSMSKVEAKSDTPLMYPYE